jgi:hypothetical protein
MIYEIRRSGQTLCRGTVPGLGYSPDVLKDMERNALHLYCDGKRIKKPPRSGNSKGVCEK